ncbi:hypothetical protein FQA39_LY11192 [Lamprigera yunnana]|nr:hypothetical protein FQA39_LY11192 [Lamprigera yunnana]
MYPTLAAVLFRNSKVLNALNSCKKSISINTTSESISPLEGVRVLDLTRIVAGPFCTMILGDLGAEIIKIERPKTGDECRKWGPPFVNDESSYFLALNRNKKSVCIDLKSEQGRNIIYELSKKCDVLVENFVPGTLAKLRLGYEHLSQVSPHLIYCSVTGYGSTGLYHNRPGYDVIASSIGGFLHITGPEDGEPTKVGVAITDISTGLYAHGAIMAALIKRAKTGMGQKIDCNLLSTQLSLLINIGSNYLNCDKEGQRWGTAHESIVPYQAFQTKDGYITVAAASNLQFVDFCNRINKPELVKNEKFATNKLRVQNRKELLEVLFTVFRSKTNQEWCKIFEGSTTPYGPVNNLEQAFNDPHVKSIGIVKEVEHSSVGPVKMDTTVQTLHLKLRKPKPDKKVQWSTETVDNEELNKKKSKCCCIYTKPKKFDESSSSENSDDECDHCQGHVEKKKHKKNNHRSSNVCELKINHTDVEMTETDPNGDTNIINITNDAAKRMEESSNNIKDPNSEPSMLR